MTFYSTHSEFRVVCDDPKELLPECDRLMGALLDLETDSVNSAAVSVDIGRGIMEIELAAEAPDLNEALSQVDQTITEAISLTGGSLVKNPPEMVEKRGELLTPA
ncbi:MAG: hypothetical protein ACRDQA_31515 [Nocardioidaceae bacterium]